MPVIVLFVLNSSIYLSFKYHPDLPVPYIFGTKLPVANISGNDWPLEIYRELEEEGHVLDDGFWKMNEATLEEDLSMISGLLQLAILTHFWKGLEKDTSK